MLGGKVRPVMGPYSCRIVVSEDFPWVMVVGPGGGMALPLLD